MNKLKGSSNAIRMKHIVAIFILSMVAALPLRTYQLLVMVNPENGFFENSNFAVPALYIIAFVFAALMVVLSFFSKGIPAPKITEGKNFVLGAVSLVLTVGFVLDVINIVQTITPQTSYGFNSYASQSLVAAFIKENGGAFLIVQLVSAVLSALYFLIFGVSYFEGKATYKKIPLLSLAPVLWGMSILISKLMKPVSFITVSELLFEIFALVFIMIFFLTFARVSTGVFTENGMWSVFGCGFAAALFGGIITIPRLITAFVGLAPVTGHPFSITHFCVEIFIVVALFSLLGFGFKTGAKNLESFSDFSFEDEENIVIKSSSAASEDAENVERSQESAVVEAVSDDEINSAMEKLFDKGNIAEIVDEVEAEEIVDEIVEEETEETIDVVTTEEEAEEIVDEVTEVETEEIVDEITEEEAEEIVDEVTEEEAEEIVDEVAEEEAEETVDEVAEEETEETVDEVTEEEAEEIVDEVTEEEAEETVDEVAEEETEEIVDEVTEVETEETVDEVTEEEAEEIVDEITEEEAEEIVDEVTEEEAEETVDEVKEEEQEEVDEFLSLADMVISDEDDDDDYQDDTVVEEAVVEDAVEAASVPSEEAEEPSMSEEPVSEAEVKAKKEKPEKKKLFKKNKKQNESQEEEIKLVSLAELRKKNSDNE